MSPPADHGLAPIARHDGSLAIVAMDQRNTLRRMYEAAGRAPEADELRAFKVDVTKALSASASAMLLDPDLGGPAAAVRAAGCGLLLAAEPAERTSWQGEPRARRDSARDAAFVAGHGGDAVKFLVQLRPDRLARPGEPDLVAEVLQVVAQVVADCQRAGVPSVVETLLYSLPGEEPLDPGRREDLVVESARLLDEIGPDLLKLEYPGSARGCARVGEAVHGPWAVLSAGVPITEFEQVIVDACDAGGASGFIAGRAFWGDAVPIDPVERPSYLGSTARRRLEDSIALLEGRAVPWWDRAR